MKEKNYRRFCRKDNGITLIVLVITIIVLLILSGISISLLTGKGGILNNAIEARNRYNIEYIKEQIELSKVNLKFQNMKITAANIKNDLVSNGVFDDGEIDILPNGEDYETIKIKKAEVDVPISKVTLYFEKG